MRISRMKKAVWTFIIFTICGCDNNPYNCSIDESILSNNDSILAMRDYKYRYNLQLSTYDEPKLKNLDHKAYRLLITYPWDRETWIYRFEKTENGGILTIQKNYTESFEKAFGISDTIIRKELAADQWKKLEETFDANCFWTLPVSIDRLGLDGRNCILEGFDPDRKNPVNKDYFIASRWSPEKDTGFWKICNYIESFEQDPDFEY